MSLSNFKKVKQPSKPNNDTPPEMPYLAVAFIFLTMVIVSEKISHMQTQRQLEAAFGIYIPTQPLQYLLLS